MVLPSNFFSFSEVLFLVSCSSSDYFIGDWTLIRFLNFPVPGMFRAVQSVRSLSTTAACRQDLIQQTFVNKIREYAKNAGNLANSDPAVKKALQDELNRLATKFQLASADVVSKLPTNFETAKVRELNPIYNATSLFSG